MTIERHEWQTPAPAIHLQFLNCLLLQVVFVSHPQLQNPTPSNSACVETGEARGGERVGEKGVEILTVEAEEEGA